MSEAVDEVDLEVRAKTRKRLTVDYHRAGADRLGISLAEWFALAADAPDRYRELVEAGDEFLDLAVGKLAAALVASSGGPLAAARLYDRLAKTGGALERELTVREIARVGLASAAKPGPILRGGPRT